MMRLGNFSSGFHYFFAKKSFIIYLMLIHAHFLLGSQTCFKNKNESTRLISSLKRFSPNSSGSKLVNIKNLLFANMHFDYFFIKCVMFFWSMIFQIIQNIFINLYLIYLTQNEQFGVNSTLLQSKTNKLRAFKYFQVLLHWSFRFKFVFMKALLSLNCNFFNHLEWNICYVGG